MTMAFVTNTTTTFNIDAKMEQELDALKAYLGAASKAEVLRKAVALLKIAKEYEAADGSIIIRNNNVDQQIFIR